MPQTASQRNPFMLMLNPEIVLAAIEQSERLGKFNRQFCRPLDRIPPGSADESESTDSAEPANSAVSSATAAS
jgi:hypothetical protein